MRPEQPCGTKKKVFFFQDGKMYFRRSTERRFYVLLTVALAILGIMAKTGLL